MLDCGTSMIMIDYLSSKTPEVASFKRASVWVFRLRGTCWIYTLSNSILRAINCSLYFESLPSNILASPFTCLIVIENY
jgi:hypothetical protein